ncbi:alpha/beta hydrolase [Pseudooceanicola sp. CBS1P-1]|uniref:Alpha/beta fold hydrolase n=1 Tax=Pseudooceanicola albus TaxID=2692189 RepID=A0A6L7G3D9_9RHOB|nr:MULTISPECIES: alpha/beta hydrolase [Pseudooceanicola]MBT9385073.1 alpha/beta hydrolase [Pseudooceanicola endophyticus]MXN18635.1 alpha/beta fold hydrolase [Pseudooceanicola albus]
MKAGDRLDIVQPVGRFRLTCAGGQGRPLVLIHGWGGEAGQWDALLPGLAGDYVLWLVDMPGGPVLPLDGPVDLPALGRGIAAALVQADLRDVLLLGHSMGGPVAVEAALAAPERVAGILGLDTLADKVFYGGAPPEEIAFRRKVFGADLPGQTRAMIDAITAPDTSDALRAAMTRDILQADPQDLLALRDAMFAWRIADRLPALAVPLRLLNSGVVDAAHRRDPLECLRDVPQTVYGQGHFPQIEAPDALLPFLKAELAALVLR